jgi:hypothetical protein
MLRTLAVLTMIVAFAAAGVAADLVSMKLCPAKAYNPDARDCKPGKALEGTSIQIDPSLIGSISFLTAVKTSKDEEIYHVWIPEKTSGKDLVYDSATKTLREAVASELNWLKERNIERGVVVIKMTAAASEQFRLRSSKTLTPALTGSWKVQIYEATETKPLGEMKFTVGPAAEEKPIN